MAGAGVGWRCRPDEGYALHLRHYRPWQSRHLPAQSVEAAPLPPPAELTMSRHRRRPHPRHHRPASAEVLVVSPLLAGGWSRSLSTHRSLLLLRQHQELPAWLNRLVAANYLHLPARHLSHLHLLHHHPRPRQSKMAAPNHRLPQACHRFHHPRRRHHRHHCLQPPEVSNHLSRLAGCQLPPSGRLSPHYQACTCVLTPVYGSQRLPQGPAPQPRAALDVLLLLPVSWRPPPGRAARGTSAQPHQGLPCRSQRGSTRHRRPRLVGARSE